PWSPTDRLLYRDAGQRFEVGTPNYAAFPAIKLGRMPAQMLVDKVGILRYIHFGHSMKDIPENSEIFELIATL
ncbi:MAG: alkyl hydroperoxide reductase/Thiol specific antioxidant/Mal allergen, partial [Sporomusa sp.]|nr:alkyl hydroperoxide reductase/Thiol specific antioxidant/Mal allergen [Sporomusa sp.]